MKGIVDPWRVSEPLKPMPKPIRDTGEKINVDQIDLDADLRKAQFCVFRSKHGSIEVRNKNIETGNDALRDLIRCVIELSDLNKGDSLESVGIHARYSTIASRGANYDKDVPAANLESAVGYLPSCGIYFVNQSYDRGMLALVRWLNRARHLSFGKIGAVLNFYGVQPMLR